MYGVGQYFLTFALLYWALVAVPAGMTSVLFATIPLWTIFIASAAGFERLRAANVVGALVAVAGLAVIFSEQLTGDIPVARAVAVLVAALAGAGTSVVVKSFPRTHPIATNAVGTAVGVPFLLVVSLVAGEAWPLPQAAATWIALAYLVASTCIAFVLLTFVILRWTPTAAAYGGVLGPIVTVILATILAGEVFGPAFFVGALIVGIGVYLGAIATTRRTAPAPAAAPAD